MLSPKSAISSEEDCLPEGTNVDTFKAELSRWIDRSKPAQGEAQAIISPEAALKLAESSLCPTIAALLRIVCTWPVTSCECERSISAMGRIKSALRSTMVQERFSDLALLHVHYSKPVDHGKVLQRFISTERYCWLTV